MPSRFKYYGDLTTAIKANAFENEQVASRLSDRLLKKHRVLGCFLKGHMIIEDRWRKERGTLFVQDRGTYSFYPPGSRLFEDNDGTKFVVRDCMLGVTAEHEGVIAHLFFCINYPDTPIADFRYYVTVVIQTEGKRPRIRSALCDKLVDLLDRTADTLWEMIPPEQKSGAS